MISAETYMFVSMWSETTTGQETWIQSSTSGPNDGCVGPLVKTAGSLIETVNDVSIYCRPVPHVRGLMGCVAGLGATPRRLE